MRQNWAWLAVVAAGLLGCQPALQPGGPTPTLLAPVVEPQAVRTTSPTPASSSLPSPVAAKSGVVLIATLGPTCPGPQREGQVCTAPYAGEFTATRADGSEAARFATDVDGRATVDLPPGAYTVSIVAGGGRSQPRGGPVEVTVTPGRYAEVVLDLDTGLR